MAEQTCALHGLDDNVQEFCPQKVSGASFYEINSFSFQTNLFSQLLHVEQQLMKQKASSLHQQKLSVASYKNRFAFMDNHRFMSSHQFNLLMFYKLPSSSTQAWPLTVCDVLLRSCLGRMFATQLAHLMSSNHKGFDSEWVSISAQRHKPWGFPESEASAVTLTVQGHFKQNAMLRVFIAAEKKAWRRTCHVYFHTKMHENALCELRNPKCWFCSSSFIQPLTQNVDFSEEFQIFHSKTETETSQLLLFFLENNS